MYDPVKRRASAKRWKSKNKDKVRAYQRKRLGIPEPDHPAPDKCDNCGGPPTGRWKSFHIDHDHATGKFRGWLCRECNCGLGLLGDDVESIQRTLDYLKRTQ